MANTHAKPDGKAVKDARIAAGMTAEELSNAAGLSLKTITNVESGKEVEIQTLRRIADALKTPYEKLLVQEQRPRRAQITVITTYLFEHFNDKEREAFVAMLTGHIPNGGTITITDVRPGSTAITLEMNEEDIVQLVTVFLAKRRNMLRPGFFTVESPGGTPFRIGVPYESSPEPQRPFVASLSHITEIRIPRSDVS